MKFKDRMQAGAILSKKLSKYANTQAVVLAVPKGGVAVAYPVAMETGLPIELLLFRNIGHPKNREYAMGTVGLEDSVMLPCAGISSRYVTLETDQIRKRLNSMRTRFGHPVAPLDLKDKIAIIIDDGTATGKTLLGAVNLVRKKSPSAIVVATPVASPLAAGKLEKITDEFIALLVEDHPNGIAGFYEDFHQLTDEEVRHFMEKSSVRNVIDYPLRQKGVGVLV